MDSGLGRQLGGETQPHAKAIVQIAISIGAIIGCVVAPIIGGMVGRRPVYFALCLLSLASCGYMFRAFDSYNMQFVLMAAVVGCITAAFYGWMPLYLSELFPTRVRATGQGLSFNFGRILAAVGACTWGNWWACSAAVTAVPAAMITLIYAWDWS